MVSSAIASRALTPSGRRRFTLATNMLLHVACCRTAVVGLTQPRPTNEKPPPLARVCHLVGPGGFEPPTSTMSRPIGRTKTRVDTHTLTF
jgi:hypothetical protein